MGLARARFSLGITMQVHSDWEGLKSTCKICALLTAHYPPFLHTVCSRAWGYNTRSQFRSILLDTYISGFQVWHQWRASGLPLFFQSLWDTWKRTHGMGLAFFAPCVFSLDEKLTHHNDEYCFSMILVDFLLAEKTECKTGIMCLRHTQLISTL